MKIALHVNKSYENMDTEKGKDISKVLPLCQLKSLQMFLDRKFQMKHYALLLAKEK